MSNTLLPLIVEPDQLSQVLNDPRILIIDLCTEQSYVSGHIPGAIYVSPAELVAGTPPAPGKLPSVSRLNQLFNRIGLTPDRHVVVYDDEGGGWAGRFIWTLDVIGHSHYSYLNGGIWSWRDANQPLTRNTTPISPQVNDVMIQAECLMTKAEIIESLKDPNFVVWDARSKEEYQGTRATAQRNGHIPNAIHCEWTELMDRNNAMRIREDAKAYLANKGFTANKPIVTHCHTHHRSGFTYLVGKMLGFDIKAYPGSWSEWGNDPNTPIEHQ